MWVALIFLGYCPFLGESFRFYFLPFSGFILLGAIFVLMNLKEFKVFLLQRDLLTWGVILMIFYLMINSAFHWGKHPKYWMYLDLGPFFVMLFGLFFGRYLSSRINYIELEKVMLVILLLLFLKVIFMLTLAFPIVPDGSGFLSGYMAITSTGFYRIIPKSSDSFLVSICCMSLVIVIFNPSVISKARFLPLGFLLLFILLLNGTRSLYLALLVVIISLMFAARSSFKKIIYLSIFLAIDILAICFIRSDPIVIGAVDLGFGGVSPGVSQLTQQNLPIFLNSITVGYRLVEILDVIYKVGGHWLCGLGAGAAYYTPGMNLGAVVEGAYVHSLPFWLYLKGGVILVSLFYGVVSLGLIKLYIQYLYHPSNNFILICFSVLIGLCILDVFSNQFSALAGSFYLGFWLKYYPSLNKN